MKRIIVAATNRYSEMLKDWTDRPSKVIPSMADIKFEFRRTLGDKLWESILKKHNGSDWSTKPDGIWTGMSDEDIENCYQEMKREYNRIQSEKTPEDEVVERYRKALSGSDSNPYVDGFLEGIEFVNDTLNLGLKL